MWQRHMSLQINANQSLKAELITANRQRDELLALMGNFCARVERGEIHSVKTYKEFSAAIANAKGTNK